MHNLYFVVVPEGDAKNAKKAMEVAEGRLEAEGFVDNDGYFSQGRSDWFVVGGRWSGILSVAAGKKTAEEVNAEKRDDCKSYPDDAMRLTPEIRKSLIKIFADPEVGVAGKPFMEFSMKELKDSHDGDWIVVIDYHN